MSERDRILWNCRRGLLELDLVLERFVAKHLDLLNVEEVDIFKQLLAFDDADLFDMVMGHAQPCNERLNDVLHKMRSV